MTKEKVIITKRHFYIGLKDDNIKEKNKRVAYFFLAPLFLLLSLEVMHLTYPNTIIRFFASMYFPVKLVITYVFLLSIQSFFYTLTQSSFLSNLLNTVLMFGLGYVTEVLGRVRGNPLLPADIMLIGNVKEIVTFAKIPFFLSAVVALVINIWSLRKHWKICRKYEKTVNLIQRIALGLMSIVAFSVVMYITCFSTAFRHNVLPKIDVKISAFNPIEDYNANGVVLTFFPRIGDMTAKQPENYSEFAINALKYKYEVVKSTATEEKPNVIIIQNEAWWDPSLMPEVEYSVDLFEGINSVEKNIVRGKFLSPVFAGGTCLPEFEVLTGLPTYLLTATAYPYTQYITSKTPTIVSAYKENGYQTVALHPYRKNFYNRLTAYPLMGFDTFKGMDDFDYKDTSGIYIDDMACVKQIIKEFENKTSDRIFEFAVTMENHGTYTTPRYENFDFEMYAPTLSEEDYMDLKRYSQGVYNADKAFKALVDYFEKVDEPVIIAMYGDHLPLLGTNGSTYMDSGYIEHTEKFVSSKYPQLYETPYVVWTNYEKPTFGLTHKVSGNTLGMKIFMATGCETPWYFNAIDAFCRKYPGTVNTAVYNNKMEKLDSINQEDMHMANDYKLLMYDILNGKKYCIKTK